MTTTNIFYLYHIYLLCIDLVNFLFLLAPIRNIFQSVLHIFELTLSSPFVKVPYFFILSLFTLVAANRLSIICCFPSFELLLNSCWFSLLESVTGPLCDSPLFCPHCSQSCCFHSLYGTDSLPLSFSLSCCFVVWYLSFLQEIFLPTV